MKYHSELFKGTSTGIYANTKDRLWNLAYNLRQQTEI